MRTRVRTFAHERAASRKLARACERARARARTAEFSENHRRDLLPTGYITVAICIPRAKYARRRPGPRLHCQRSPLSAVTPWNDDSLSLSSRRLAPLRSHAPPDPRPIDDATFHRLFLPRADAVVTSDAGARARASDRRGGGDLPTIFSSRRSILLDSKSGKSDLLWSRRSALYEEKIDAGRIDSRRKPEHDEQTQNKLVQIDIAVLIFITVLV